MYICLSDHVENLSGPLTKFLGVIIDDLGLWKDHINWISSKISKGIGMILNAQFTLTEMPSLPYLTQIEFQIQFESFPYVISMGGLMAS